MTDAELDALAAQIEDDIRSGEVGPNIMCRQIDKAFAALRQERDAARAEVEALRKKYEVSAAIGIERLNRAEKAEAEVEALRHDVERHVAIAAEQATEIEELRDDLAAERARLDYLDAECSSGPGGAHICCLSGHLRRAIDAALAGSRP